MGQWELLQIPRNENSEADLLAKAVSEANKTFQELELTEELTKPSIEEEEMMSIQETAEWMKPIIQYLEHSTLPEDKLKAQKLRVKTAHYSMHNDELYRRSLSHPWSKCVSPKEGNYVLREIHEGYAELMKPKTPSSEKLCCKVTTGLIYRRTPFSSFRSVPSVNNLLV